MGEVEQNSNKGGRPKIELDYDKLDELCAIFCTRDECAAALGMSDDTLNRRLQEDGFTGFAAYFAQKNLQGKVSLRRKQFEMAMDGNIKMLMWLGKQYLGQSDRPDSTNVEQLSEFLKELIESHPD